MNPCASRSTPVAQSVSQRLVRSVAGGRMPAVEVMLNSKLISELIERGDFSGVKEAMEKSLAEGSQTYEEDLARMILGDIITREEGLAYADSPTNLMWRLQNDMSSGSKERAMPKREEVPDDQPSFTEITIDVRPEDAAVLSPNLRQRITCNRKPRLRLFKPMTFLNQSK